jgi:hypothetical protein
MDSYYLMSKAINNAFLFIFKNIIRSKKAFNIKYDILRVGMWKNANYAGEK